MQSSKAYEYLIKQLNATGSEKKDGYNPRVLEEIYDWERNEAEDLINIGAYKSGSNPDIDYAISMNKKVNEFLLQDVEEKVEFEDSVQRLMDMFEGV